MKYIYMNKTDSIAVSDRHISICTMKGAVSELNEVTQRAEAAEARAAQAEAERDELARKLEQAQRKIDALATQLGHAMTA